jgi:hypothetical protein
VIRPGVLRPMTRYLGGTALVLMTACHPSSVADAESKGDVGWLEQNGTPDAVAALGRLGDHDPRAIAALNVRVAYDAGAYRAAWMATLREATWGSAMLRAGLADPKTADLAASGMGKHEPHLAPFVDSLEGALVRLSASTQNLNIADTLASVGVAARPAVERRLADVSTRGAMCAGIASRYGDRDARSALFSAPQASRDAPACVDAVVRLAADDDWALSWLAERGEPGLLGAAGKNSALSCARLHVAWVKALGARPAQLYPALAVPLGYAIARCPAQIDGILADAIVHTPAAHGVVILAIDPFANYEDGLRATCAALPAIASGPDTAVIRERANDAMTHICKAPE